MSWLADPLLGFDTETTGVDVFSDRIITASLVKKGPQVIDVLNWIIDPGIPIPPEATAVHGITDEYVAIHGHSARDSFNQIANNIAYALSEEIPLVAFNIGFDLQILQNELTRLELPGLDQRFDGRLRPLLDPLVLDRALDPYRKGPRTLGALADHYGLPDLGLLHTSEVDTMFALELLYALVDTYPQLQEMSLEELYEFQAQAHYNWATNYNKWRLKQGYEGLIPTTWPLTNRNDS